MTTGRINQIALHSVHEPTHKNVGGAWTEGKESTNTRMRIMREWQTFEAAPPRVVAHTRDRRKTPSRVFAL